MRFVDAFPDLIDGLRARYGEAHRAYHTWAHVEALLTGFETVGWADPAAVEIALYYHDAVYQPLSASNEADSAALMRDELKDRVRTVDIGYADAIILATANHRVPETASPDLAGDIAYFLDLDLSILGAPTEKFDLYDRQIRKEFAAIPDEVFLPRRRVVMAGFLERERLFLTDRFNDIYDAPARANLSRLVARLPDK